MSRLTVGAAGAVLVSVIALGACGCAAQMTAEPSAEPVAAVSSPVSDPLPAYQLDTVATALAESTHELLGGIDGFASPESRAELETAVIRLDLDLAAAAAGKATASVASGGWNQIVALDGSAVRAALDGVRGHVIITALRVLNEETLEAEQSVRDSLYVAVVEQQGVVAATDATPAQLTALISMTRAAQAAEASALAEQSRLSSEGEAAEPGETSAGSEEAGFKAVGDRRLLEQFLRQLDELTARPDCALVECAVEP